jgi:hypothetical protein
VLEGGVGVRRVGGEAEGVLEVRRRGLDGERAAARDVDLQPLRRSDEPCARLARIPTEADIGDLLRGDELPTLVLELDRQVRRRGLKPGEEPAPRRAVDQTEDGRKYLANVKSEKVVKMSDADYNVVREATAK